MQLPYQAAPSSPLSPGTRYNQVVDKNIQAALIDLNQRFYQDFGRAFAATRRRIQPGVRRVLRSLPTGGQWLDLGCGSGALAREWALSSRSGSYLGVDFSPVLLDEARQAVAGQEIPRLQIHFAPADLTDESWMTVLGAQPRFEGVLAFAVLHHLPGSEMRRRVLQQVRALLCPGGVFIHSEWQFQHSEKLLARRQPWEVIGISPQAVEPGDTLLDWRYAIPEQAEKSGLRYVHLFDRAELSALAGQTGFLIREEFESDGEGGRLGLYQVWTAV